MGTQVVEMDYDVIKAVSKGFEQTAEALRIIAQILEGLVNAMKASFILRIFLEAVIQWLEGIKEALNKLADVCEEFASDLSLAVKFHQQGDVSGGRFFQGGI
jgi:hypothetical protein